MRKARFLALVPAFALLAACSSPPGASVDDKREAVRKMRDQTLAQLLEANPSLREKLDGAVGYAVFTNLNLHLLAVSGADGYGLAVDGRNGDETFMRVASIGGGPGIAMRDFRSIFIFTTQDALDRFLETGWQFSLTGGAAAKTSDRGGAAGGVAAVSSGGREHATVQTQATRTAAAAAGEGVEVYQLTQSGLALHAAALGTRYFRDTELN